ncbi:hypothetical protein BDV25DRAFT_20629 [Aspergillus avenaceus]|uniref:25S rRNA (uridine-N(3))-methyltransferase BMT5-like domain-containing protein n=1 Tax=Aspergillus avenaceus TaxID=36643 RepID=A0A5N6TPL3_ASPAV|nr:hypothetical protein BDV25DRAFT_20629 [Aspergillus avenaceus]
MAKNKRLRSTPTNRGNGSQPKKARKMRTFSKLSTVIHSGPSTSKPSDTGSGNKINKNTIHQRQNIPFDKRDRILLIGEGDFSFARSLVVQHRCKNILATCYDSKDDLYSKYPQAESNVRTVLSGVPSCKKHRDILGNSVMSEETERKEQREANSSGNHGHRTKEGMLSSYTSMPEHLCRPKVMFSVDARKLGRTPGSGKDIRVGYPRRDQRLPAWQQAKKNCDSPFPKGGPWDVICFNFPHVGGLSTDVNRQVRANQELLVAFFKASVPLLSSPLANGSDDIEEEYRWDTSDGSDTDSDKDSVSPDSRNMMGPNKSSSRNGPGQILVTLFEGEPYTLWNIRDLARHAGLKVVTSFRFPWDAYQGYSHARTLGEIQGKHGGRGGWKGEQREARMYVFELNEESRITSTQNPQSSKNAVGTSDKKRPRASDSDDSD